MSNPIESQVKTQYKGNNISDIVNSQEFLTKLSQMSCFPDLSKEEREELLFLMSAYSAYQNFKQGAGPSSNFTTYIQQTTETVDDKEVDYGPAAGKMWIILQAGHSNDGGGVAQDFKLYDGSTEVPIIESDTPATGVYTYLTEEASVLVPIKIANGTYFRFYANLAGGKKMVTRLIYNEYNVY